MLPCFSLKCNACENMSLRLQCLSKSVIHARQLGGRTGVVSCAMRVAGSRGRGKEKEKAKEKDRERYIKENIKGNIKGSEKEKGKEKRGRERAKARVMERTRK